MVRCNTPGEAPEVVEARKTWFVPGARSAIPGHEVGLVRNCSGHGSSMEVPGVWVMDQPQNSWWYGKLT